MSERQTATEVKDLLDKLLQSVEFVGGCGTSKTHGANTGCNKFSTDCGE